MRKATLSQNSIRAFESVTRHESFAKAAKGLSVPASVASQQVS
jgi:DNA-binding transcriptional LysR family regulator